MEKITSKCGYTVYKATADDTKKLGGMGICDYCGKYSGSGYLIPVVNSYYCPKCYAEWDNSGRYYEEDIPAQDRTAAYYESCIEGNGGDGMTTGEMIERLIRIKDNVPLGQSEIDTINEVCKLLGKLPNALTTISALEEQTEDKRLICSLLTITLQVTRDASDLILLEFDPETEFVTARFVGGGGRRINVDCDSGVAMIRDIMKHLGV